MMDERTQKTVSDELYTLNDTLGSIAASLENLVSLLAAVVVVRNDDAPGTGHLRSLDIGATDRPWKDQGL
jgi:hypothetical protein